MLRVLSRPFRALGFAPFLPRALPWAAIGRPFGTPPNAQLLAPPGADERAGDGGFNYSSRVKFEMWLHFNHNWLHFLVFHKI